MSAEMLSEIHNFLVKGKGNPYFKVQSHNIQILESPIDFYLALCKGIRISSKRLILSSLYIGEGALEHYLLDQIFNKLEVNDSIRMSFLVDYHRGSRGEKFNSVNFFHPFKANFQPNPNIRVGFYHNTRPISFPSKLIQEVRGVQHMKMAVFDDNVILTGANMSESYFTDREDRWIVFKESKELADYCDDLANSVIDFSYQMNDEGRLVMPRYVPKKVDSKRKMIQDRVKLFKFMQDEGLDLKVEEMNRSQDPATGSQGKKAHEQTQSTDSQALTRFTHQVDQSRKLKSIAKRTDVFNTLKDMPEEFNIITGSGGWKNEVIETGGPVYLFPCLQLSYFGINDDLDFLKHILPKFDSLSLASAYMNFPQELLASLKQVKDLSLLSASPYANGFIGDGVKNWIPYFYQALRDQAVRDLPQAQFSEYFREGWTFHSKGIWADGNLGTCFSNIGGSNFSRRSFGRDIEFQVYMWSQCPKFNAELGKERNRIWKFAEKDLDKHRIKYRAVTQVLAKALKTFL